MPTGRPAPSASAFTRRAALAAAVLMALSVLWSLATPLGGGPDERDHAARAYSAIGGTLVGAEAELGGGSAEVEVPVWITRLEAYCYAFHTEQPVSCAPYVGSDTTATTWVTRAGQAPPLYHLATGAPLRAAAGRVGLFSARLLSAAAAAAMVGVAVALASLHRNRTLLVPAVLLAWTPTAAFLSGVLNPSTWEIAAALLTWVAGLVLVDDDVALPVRVPATALAVGGAVLALDRQLSPLFLAAAGAAVVAVAGWGRIVELLAHRSVRIMVGVLVLAGLAAVAWLLLYRPLESGTDIDFATDDTDAELTANAFGRQSLLLIQMVAWFGWLDLRGPSVVTTLWLAAAALVLLLALVTARRRDIAVLAAVVGAAVALPTVIEATSIRTHGQTWQGRYTLPLALGALVVAAARARIDDGARPLVQRIGVALCLVVAAGHLMSYGAALRRNVVGTDRPFWTTISAPLWNPPTTPWLLLGGATVVSMAVGWVGWRLSQPPAPTPARPVEAAP